ncbi:SPFH domain-containing protein [Ferrovum sp.]|uniref:SPFH domain-containing protein n=1 Tax=Ferrovum sp. TaxID=2609467 RepID=UPI002626225A|nr:SPFH domain-containing protein [Ferrovum sp.]
MKSKQIGKMVAAMAMLTALAILSGCTRIPTGSVGVQQHFDGTIDSTSVNPGMYLSILDRYMPIDTTMTRAGVHNLQPKDSNGVALKNVHVVITFQLDPSKVAAFYVKTKELDEEPNGLYITGLKILQESVIPYAVQLATEKSDLATISAHLGDYAETIRQVSVSRLDQLYPDNPIIIKSVTVPDFELPESIQRQVNAKAGYLAELQTIEAQKQVVEQKQQLLQAQATVSANALAQAAHTTGLSVEQIIAWERVAALKALAGAKTGAAVMVGDR